MLGTPKALLAMIFPPEEMVWVYSWLDYPNSGCFTARGSTTRSFRDAPCDARVCFFVFRWLVSFLLPSSFSRFRIVNLFSLRIAFHFSDTSFSSLSAFVALHCSSYDLSALTQLNASNLCLSVLLQLKAHKKSSLSLCRSILLFTVLLTMVTLHYHFDACSASFILWLHVILSLSLSVSTQSDLRSASPFPD